MSQRVLIGYVHYIGDRPFFSRSDPREVHDNGKPCFPVYANADDLIEQWHTKKIDLSLQEFLGMTDGDYHKFVG